MTNQYADSLRNLSIIQTPIPVDTSTGPTNSYLDGLKMLMLDPDYWTKYFINHTQNYWPVAAGRSGAYILGLLHRGTLVNLNKNHGLPHSGFIMPPNTLAILVDDVKFSGATMAALHTYATNVLGYKVMGSVVAWPYVHISDSI